MTVSIEFDVPIDVVDEMAQAIVVVFRTIERLEKPSEHFRDDVFAAVEERRQDLFRYARIDQRHRMRNEDLHMGRYPDPHEGRFNGNADLRQRAERVELECAGT